MRFFKESDRKPDSAAMAKAEALAALATWSSTTRAELVAAAWHAGNRNITELHRVAGVGRQAIYADLAKHDIHPPAQRLEPLMPATVQPAEVDVPGWRHPHLLKVTLQDRGFGHVRMDFQFKPFDGTELEPEIPDEWRYANLRDLPPDQAAAFLEGHEQRQHEIRAIRQVWAKARATLAFGHLWEPSSSGHFARPVVFAGVQEFMGKVEADAGAYVYSYGWSSAVRHGKTAADEWTDYAAARDKLAQAYEAMKTQPDNEWRAGLGRIVDATEPAEKAARQWDGVAGQFMALATWYEGFVPADERSGELRALAEIAAAAGHEISDWQLADDSSAYHRSDSWGSRGLATDEINAIIEQGKAWLDKVDALAGGDR